MNPRPWYRLHRSTLAVMAVAIVCAFWGEWQFENQSRRLVVITTFEYGWPFCVFAREEIIPSDLNPSSDDLDYVRGWRPVAIIADLAIVALLIGALMLIHGSNKSFAPGHPRF